MLSIKIALSEFDQTRAALGRLKALLVNQAEINAVVEVASEKAVKDHLADHYAILPNKLNGASTGFYKKAIEGTHASSDGTTVTVAINQLGIRLRYYGGVVRPTGRTSEVTGKPIRFLAFPVDPLVYGKSPAEVAFKMYARPGGLFRQEGDKPNAATDDKMFALARQTTHLPDPNILPSDFAVIAHNVEALNDLIDAATEGSPLA